MATQWSCHQKLVLSNPGTIILYIFNAFQVRKQMRRWAPFSCRVHVDDVHGEVWENNKRASSMVVMPPPLIWPPCLGMFVHALAFSLPLPHNHFFFLLSFMHEVRKENLTFLSNRRQQYRMHSNLFFLNLGVNLPQRPWFKIVSRHSWVNSVILHSLWIDLF
jgi:hypothetical protein